MKKVIILFIGVCLICLGILNENEKENNELYNADVINKEENTLSMMLETEFNSGKYEETTGSSWPAEGYLFNSTLSKCKNGSSLSWDNDKKQVIFEGNTKDDCYVYFDKEPLYLYKYIKKLYTGVQGENNLYYHNSSLTNGAGDYSYRYAGSSETTNNFVCFGYDSVDGSCPTDNLYRIIGVFDNQVKLIKYDYATSDLLGTDASYSSTYSKASFSNGTSKGNNSKSIIGVYVWTDGSYNTIKWSKNLLNLSNLNTNYLNNIGTNWSNKIAIYTWKVGGNSASNIYNVTVPKTYTNEITSPTDKTTYDAKVGLMYVSDYGYAAAPSAWTITLYIYDSEEIPNENWMCMGLNEWTITNRTDATKVAHFVPSVCSISDANVNTALAIRPVFYLNSNVTYVSGFGTKIEPILIK